MSGSLTEPENAAPTAPVRPEQGTGKEKQGSEAVGADHIMAPQRPQFQQPIPPSRSLSNSLLTRGLAALKETASQDTTAVHESALSTQANTPASLSNFTYSGHNNGLSQSENSAGNMALALPPRTPGVMSGMTPSHEPSASTATFLGDIDHVNSLLMSHRAFLNKTRARGTSLERTDKERRVGDNAKGHATHNPGDTALPRLSTHESPTSSTPISNNEPIDGVRARYRSWRDARPVTGAEMAWSIGDNGDDSGQEGQVEKSIAEALAGIEPNVRSRKASHSLRVFKEGLPEKKREGRTRGRSKERAARPRDISEAGEENAPTIVVEAPDVTSGITSPDTGTSRTISSSSLSRESTSDTAGPKSSSNYFDVTTAAMKEDTTLDETQKLHTLPPQLLDEIRKHHNLTAGGIKGSSFSPSIPNPESDRGTSPMKKKHHDSESEESGHDDDDDVKKTIKQNRKEEDEEGGKEKISSALFVPHQTPHESPERERDSSQSPERSRSRERGDANAAPESWLVEHEIPTHELEKYGSAEKEPATECKTPEEEMATPTRSPVKATFEFPDSQSEYEYESQSEAGYSTVAEDSQTDDPELTPTGRKPGQYMSDNRKKNLHGHQQISKAPAEAIELVPYRHQVGGHTTMWRFSQRAVCKQLNNRENEFYEKVEHYHPRLLKFLPKYIGVLNVTYERQKRKEPKKDGGEGTSANAETANGESAVEGDGGKAKENEKSSGQASGSTAPRMISNSMSSSSSIPTVTFADNRHIIPKSFLHPLQLTPAPSSSAPVYRSARAKSEPQAEPPLPGREFTFSSTLDRPSLADKHAVSWGATTVNKKLRNEVFGEAFLQTPIPVQRHRKPAHQNRALPARRTNSGGHLRASNSESSLITAQQTTSIPTTRAEPAEESMRRKAMKGAAEKSGLMPMTPIKPTGGGDEQSSGVAIPGVDREENDKEEEGDDKTGTSAPEPEIPPTPSDKGKKKRRYSSGALRRKPDEVQDARGHLKYFEEADDAGYKGDGEEEVFSMDPEPHSAATSTAPIAPASAPDQAIPSVENNQLDGLVNKTNELSLAQSTEPPLEKSVEGTMLPAARDEEPGLLPSALPRPVNPKEAQTQPDKRVEYFLLLEDLTAGMKRPCIMDLKMGTRQYGVEANEKKQKSQRRKCATTTSKELGVRVCGLQVWDASMHAYVFQDKYFGRDLKAGDQFQEALTRFLYDGVDYSSVLRHIPTILRKLSQLEVLIQGLHGYRFYAASLLMFYDGDLEDADDSETDDTSATKKKERVRRKKDIDFKIADFANCVTAEDVATVQTACPPRHPGEPDRGFLRGLRSLRRYFEWIQRDVEDKLMGVGGEGADEGWVEDEGEVSY